MAARSSRARSPRHRCVEGDRGVHRQASGRRGGVRGRQLRLQQGGGRRVVGEIAGKGGKAIAVQATSPGRTTSKLFAEAKKAFGRLDVLVNNAGIYEFAPLEGDHRRELPQAVRAERPGLILTTQEAVKHFGASGGRWSISARSSATALPGATVYSATKAAVDSITRTLARSLARRVRVNAVNPGMVETEGNYTARKAATCVKGQEKPAGTHRPGGRHRPGRRVLRLGRLEVGDRRDAVHVGRLPLIR